MTSTQIYEIKKGRKWTMVRATSMANLDRWCSENGYTDWRMAGMMSASQLKESQNLTVVA